MRFLSIKAEATLKDLHYNAIESYVKSKTEETVDDLYGHIRKLFPRLSAKRNKADFSWLKDFILAPLSQIEFWAANNKKDLNFSIFRMVYKNRFANGTDNFVDPQKSYNAYKYFSYVDVSVCPYCDAEIIGVVEENGISKRKGHIDHFFPKANGFFPGLAMCFYNLVPSCTTCNSWMITAPIEANPYNPDIEKWSHFISAIPPGSNLDALALSDFKINLVAQKGMIANKAVLLLEARYNKLNDEIRDILLGKRNLSDPKCHELIKLGVSPDFFAHYKSICLGSATDMGHRPYAKLRKDLTS